MSISGIRGFFIKLFFDAPLLAAGFLTIGQLHRCHLQGRRLQQVVQD